MIKYKYIPNEQNSSFSKAFLNTLIILFPLTGYLLVILSMSINGFHINLSELTFPIIIQINFLVLMFVLYMNEKKIDLFPVILISIITGVGLVFQFQISLYPSISNNILMVPTGLTNQYISVVISQFLFVIVFIYFKRNNTIIFFSKYLTVFFATMIILSLLIALSQIVEGGEFLFSRTPWELAKIFIPISLAGFLSQNSYFLKSFSKNSNYFHPVVVLTMIMILIIPFILFVMLGDTGQVFLYGFSFILICYLGTENKIFLAAGLMGFIIIPIMFSFFDGLIPNYILNRLSIWQDFWNGFPSSVWWDKSFQTANGIFAMNSGGWLGTGIGNGYSDFIPLANSDFVFPAIAEQIGFVGTFAIFLLYLSLIIFCFKIASKCLTNFEYLVVCSLTTMLISQIFINIGGVLNILPMTGIVLPFISKGGFSMITFYIIISIITAISTRNQNNPKL